MHIYCLFLCFERFHCIVLVDLKLKFRDLPACFSVMGLKVCVAGWRTHTPLNLKNLLFYVNECFVCVLECLVPAEVRRAGSQGTAVVTGCDCHVGAANRTWVPERVISTLNY